MTKVRGVLSNRVLHSNSGWELSAIVAVHIDGFGIHLGSPDQKLEKMFLMLGTVVFIR